MKNALFSGLLGGFLLLTSCTQAQRKYTPPTVNTGCPDVLITEIKNIRVVGDKMTLTVQITNQGAGPASFDSGTPDNLQDDASLVVSVHKYNSGISLSNGTVKLPLKGSLSRFMTREISVSVPLTSQPVPGATQITATYTPSVKNNCDDVNTAQQLY